MRRKDREITSLNDIKAIVAKARVCRVAFFDEAYPYIVPLNFGFEEDGGKLTLYFHCANEGKKLDLLRRNNHVAFELDCPGTFHDGDKACQATMEFESVCGNGTLALVSDDEKIPALERIMRQYSDKKSFDFDAFEVKAVTVLKLTVNEVTGKRLKK